MPAVAPQTVKLKSTLRLLVSRLRIAQQKDTSMSIAARREMSDLLAQSRESSARIRVENIIHTDITVELMEILELYAELLQARAGLLDIRDKNIKEGLPVEDTGLEEAAASIIYAAPRLARDVRELNIVRGMLIDRFGKEFAVRASDNTDNCVPARVVDKLKADPPKEKLVQAYLEEIARTYNVDWPPRRHEVAAMEAEIDNENDDDGVGGGQKEAPILADSTSASATAAAPATPKKIDLGGLQRATPPANIGARSPVSVAPPGARTDNPQPAVRLPGGQQVSRKEDKPAASNALGAPPTVDDLAKRFQALKR